MRQDDSAIVTMIDNVDGVACIRLIGDMDLAVDGALDRTLVRLITAPRTAVYVDLAAVGFAGSTLVNFLARIVATMSTDGSLLLCRPTPTTQRLIKLCSLEDFATVRMGLPADFTTDPR